MRVTPCLWFDDQGEEAANFYVGIFPNSKITRINRYTAASPERAGAVVTVEFELDGQPFVALNGGPQFTFSEAVSFQVPCASQEEIDYYWAALSAGGKQGPCGWLGDRYGLAWQVYPAELLDLLDDPAVAEPVSRAMYAMGKLDLAELRAAAGR